MSNEIKAIEAFGGENEISLVELTTEEIAMMDNSPLIYILLGDEDEIDHVISLFDITAYYTEAGEYLIFANEEFEDEVYDEMVDCGVTYELARR